MNTMVPVRMSASTPSVVGLASGSEQEQVPLLRHLLRIALRWKKVLIAAVGGCLLLGLIVTLLMTPQYTAATSIEIARESNRIVNIQGVEQEASDADQEFYQTQYGLLNSRSLAERIAVQLKLVDDLRFFAMFDADDGAAFMPGANGRLPAAGRDKRIATAGQILLDDVSISPVRASRLVEISFTSPDPVLSSKVANAWSANFIEATLQRRFDATSYARRFLEDRLKQLRERLEQSERQLVTYASQQQIINLPNAGAAGERSIIAEQLAAVTSDLSQATADRVRAEARYRASGGNTGETGEALNNNAINSLRTKRAELAAEYQKLLTQFEPGYPAAQALQSQIRQLDRSLVREESRIGGTLATSFNEQIRRETALQERSEQLKKQLLDLRRRSIQYQIFQREVDTNRQLYDGLLQRYKEIGVAGGVGVNNVAVVDRADVPERPSRPRLVLNMLLAMLSGLAIGGIAAFLLEQSDEEITDPTEVERMLGLALLGSVPKLVGRSPADALRDRKSDLVDAYLAVQTNLSFSTDHGLPTSLMVTSTRPSEGKSTTALSLATTLARAQKNVVLIDGDMRSPSVHQLIGTNHDKGLSNFLAGGDEIHGLIHHVAQFGFAAMTAGPIPPNAAELLTGDRLRLLIERLLESYDHVVIDSPPVMGLADAPLIGSRVEAVIYAVEAHGIRSSLVLTALSRLQAANARVVGAVLTKFVANKSGLGYGYEYGYSYGRSAKGNDPS